MKTVCFVILAVVIAAVTSELQDAGADSKEVFKCPVCTSVKESFLSAEESCDNVAVYYDCQYEDPVCVSTRTKGLVMRDCFSKKYYNDYIKPTCDSTPGCEHVMCEKSGCKATFPEGDWFENEEYKPMECPVCIGIGKDAVKDCEKSSKFFTCNAKEAVCMSMKNGGLLIRDCVNVNYYYNKLVGVCTQKLDDCEIAFCMNTKCTAKLPSSVPPLKKTFSFSWKKP